MNNLLVDTAKRIAYIIDSTKYRSQLPDMWILIYKEYTILISDEIFNYLFLYYCERFMVSGVSRSGAFDEMMLHAYDMKYTEVQDDTILRDIMCVCGL